VLVQLNTVQIVLEGQGSRSREKKILLVVGASSSEDILLMFIVCYSVVRFTGAWPLVLFFQYKLQISARKNVSKTTHFSVA